MKSIYRSIKSIDISPFLLNLVGVGLLFAVWYLLVLLASQYDDNFIYAEISPLKAVPDFFVMIGEADYWVQLYHSLYRVGSALAISLLIGIPLGLLYAQKLKVKSVLYVPFQFLRMISPLSWMPISILLFDTWDGSIIFLIVMAAIWPLVFNITQGVSKIDIGWIYVARSFRASVWQQLRYAIIPAVAQDLLTGLRLALGVAWIVIVPAEYLGVTSGLGYSINDARDTLDYSRLMALIISIGITGAIADAFLQYLSAKFRWQ